MTTLEHLTLTSLATSAVLAMTACAGDAVILPHGEVSYARHVESIVVTRCESCHSEHEPKARLVLERGQGYGQLVERSSIQVDQSLVVAGDPEASYLWHKLMDTAEEGQGMPRNALGYRRLPDAELELIRRWIEDGARP